MASLIRRYYRDKTTGARRRTSKWYGQDVDAEGIRRRVPLASNKEAARAMLAELVRQVERGRAGLLDPFHEHHARPLADHLADFEAALRAKGGTEANVKLVTARARKV